MQKPSGRRASEFGGYERYKEECRESLGAHFFETLLQDVRFGWRTLRKSPGFAAVAVLTLALGIGATTGIFSVVQGVVLAPLPYRDPDRLVIIFQKNQNAQHLSISLPDFEEWRRGARWFEQMAGFRYAQFDLTAPGEPERVTSFEISSGFFHTLGAKLRLGREFSPQEDQAGGAPVAIISDRLWTKVFARSSRALGQSVTLNGVPRTIVGILPPGFHLWSDIDIYIPLSQGNPMFNDRRFPGIICLARLKPGAHIAEAQSTMSMIQRQLDQSYPTTDRGFGADVEPLKPLIVGDVSDTLFLLLGAVAVLLLIACANIAGLLLSRSMARTREFAIRSALGGSRLRLVRQLLTECVLLSVTGGMLGLAVARGVVELVLALLANDLPRSANIGLNGPVLLFTFGISVLAGILFGVAPALRSFRRDLQISLRQGTPGSGKAHHRAQETLVIGQMALTLVLLAAAGLLLRTIRELSDVNPGFNAANLISFKVGLPPSAAESPSDARTASRELIESIRHVPGVQSAEVTNLLPLQQLNNFAPFWIGTHPDTPLAEAPRLMMYWTGPDYLASMKIPLLEGRFLTEQDNANSQRVAVIDSVLAHTYFPNRSPLGQAITINLWGDARIVGVVGHVRHASLGDSAGHEAPQIYASLAQLPDQAVPVFYRELTVIVRTPVRLSTVLPAIRKAVSATAGGQPVYDSQSMREVVAASMNAQRCPMILLGAFAGLALLLASVGLYGVISYSISQRVREIGIRMALGAERAGIFQMVIRQGIQLAAAGVVMGVAAGLFLARVVSSFSHLLYEVRANDPATFLCVSLVLVAVAVLACWLPARRAMRVDPMIALRCE